MRWKKMFRKEKVEQRFKLKKAIPSFERLDKGGTVMVYGEKIGGKRVNIVYDPVKGEFKIVAEGFSASIPDDDLKFLEEGEFATVIRKFVRKYADFLPKTLVKEVINEEEDEKWIF